MIAIPLDHPALVVRGALEIERTAHVLRASRLPRWTQARWPEPRFGVIASTASGVRLAFRTDSDLVEVDVEATGLQRAGEARRPVVFDVRHGDHLVERLASERGPTWHIVGANVELAAGEAETLRFAGGGAIELWWPQSASVAVRGLRIRPGSSVEPDIAQGPRWGHYGSAISHGLHAAGPSQTWPAVAARALGRDLVNLGLAWQCQLDGFVARAIRDGGFDEVSLEIGLDVVATDTLRERTFGPAVHAFLDVLRDGRPELPIALVTPLACPAIEGAPGPLRRTTDGRYVRDDRPRAEGALTLRRARAILADVVRARADPALRVVDGLALFPESEGAELLDGVHPDSTAHVRIGQRFAGLESPLS